MKQFVSVFAILILVCAITFLVWLSQRSVGLKQQQPVAISVADVNAFCQFIPGERAAFKLRSDVTTEGQTDHFAAVMSWEVETVDTNTARIRAVLSEVDHSQKLVLPTEKADSPEGVPFFLNIGKNCLVKTKSFSMQWDEKTRMLVAIQLDNFSFELPAPNTGASDWEVEAVDGLGSYTAHYSFDSIKPIRIKRQKVDRSAHSDASLFGIDIQMDKAEAFASFDDVQPLWWQLVKGEEQITIQLQGQADTTMIQRFSLERMDTLFTDVPAFSLDEAEEVDPYSAVTVDAVQLKTTHQSYEQARQAFDRAMYQASPNYYEAALELAAWLKEHPEDVALLVDELRSNLDDNARPTAFLALEISGTNEAKRALIGLIDDFALTAVDQARAASALSDVRAPTREVADILLQRAGRNDMAGRVSLLGVGAMVPNIEDEQLHTYVVGAVNDRLAVAVNESDVLLVLDTIGNTKDLDFLNVLTEKLEVGPSATRRHAAKALAKLPAAHATPVLLAQLEKESDSNVSTTLVKALNETGAPSSQVISTLEQRLSSATTKERVAIVDLLGQQKNEQAQQVLVQQFKRETNVRIQQQIGRYVDAKALR